MPGSLRLLAVHSPPPGPSRVGQLLECGSIGQVHETLDFLLCSVKMSSVGAMPPLPPILTGDGDESAPDRDRATPPPLGGGAVPRTAAGLRSRRELGSFYMRRNNGESCPGLVPLANTNGGSGSGESGESARMGFSARRAPSIAKGMNLMSTGGVVSNGMGGSAPKVNAQVMESFAKLSPAERQQLMQDLEKRMATTNEGAAVKSREGVITGRRTIGRQRSRSFDPRDPVESSSENSSNGLEPPGRFFDNPVEVSSPGNDSIFSDAEEVESEELEGESREVGEEVERWLNEGLESQVNSRAAHPNRLAATKSTPALVKPTGASSEKYCAECDKYSIKVSAMESTMSKMQNEMAELRVRLRKSEKKAKSWGVKIGRHRSSNKVDQEDATATTRTKSREVSGTSAAAESNGDKIATVPLSRDASIPSVDSDFLLKELEELKLKVRSLTTKLEDTEMERDHYRQAAKLHIEMVINREKSK